MTAQQGLGLVWLVEQERGRDFFLATPNNSPWVHVDFPTGPDKYAIWNSTGSVYKCEGQYDEIPDDPIYTPPPYTALEGTSRLAGENSRLSDAVDALILLVLEYGTGQRFLREQIERIAPGVLGRLTDVQRIHAD